MKRIASALGLAASLSLIAGPVGAATVFLDAAAGHVQLTFAEDTYKDAQVNNNNGWLKVFDGREMYLPIPNVGSTVITAWDIHVPITGTNQNWTVTARGSDASCGLDCLSQRICTYTSTGIFFTCGNSVVLNSASTAFVPTDGTALSQTNLKSKCPAGGTCWPSGRLSSIKATNN